MFAVGFTLVAIGGIIGYRGIRGVFSRDPKEFTGVRTDNEPKLPSIPSLSISASFDLEGLKVVVSNHPVCRAWIRQGYSYATHDALKDYPCTDLPEEFHALLEIKVAGICIHNEGYLSLTSKVPRGLPGSAIITKPDQCAICKKGCSSRSEIIYVHVEVSQSYCVSFRWETPEIDRATGNTIDPTDSYVLDTSYSELICLKNFVDLAKSLYKYRETFRSPSALMRRLLQPPRQQTPTY